MNGCVHHVITPLTRGYSNIFRVDVYRGSTLVDVDADGEATFEGGTLVATLYRRSMDLAHAAGIDYSFRTSTRKGA